MKTFLANQFLQTLFLGSAGGSIVYFISVSSKVLSSRLYGMFRSDITIRSTDPNYMAVVDFITERFLNAVAGARSSMEVTTRKKKQTWKEQRAYYMGVGDKKADEVDIRPGDDSSLHTFEYMGTMMTFYRKKKETLCVGYERKPMLMEELTLSMWGRDNAPLVGLIHDALYAAREKEDSGVTIFVQSNSWCGGFEKAFSRKPRSQESVILDVDHSDHLLDDARSFLQKSEWYNSMGIPYRRGYLLHGPLGSS